MTDLGHDPHGATPNDNAPDLDQLCVDTIRTLAIDAVQRANSGHPGMPMGMADTAYTLWSRHLRFDARDPTWPDRDRFVLSAGHGSMLQYALLHLCGFDVSMDDIRNFRQWESSTPGHPEYGDTPGVEATTGPLGQGLAMAVGMALGEARLRAQYGAALVDHRTFVIAGDGCMMEGISSEAASIAGHLGLDRLIVLYDDNRITIDGSTDIAFTEDVGKRFDAFGWSVTTIDGHDRDAVDAALTAADADRERPSLIRCKTVIGKMSPNLAGSNKSHGSPLGDVEIALTKQAMGWDPTLSFHVPDGVYEHMRARNDELASTAGAWRQRSQSEAGRRFMRRIAPDLNTLLADISWPSQATGSKLATRKASHAVIQALSETIEGLLGGSADLEGSNGTRIASSGHLSAADLGPRNVHYGVREHAMAAIANGLALHGGHLPFVGTFLMFHDYMRPAVRLSALMRQQVIYVYTHDSIFLGEDGPTHQPVETLMALRGVPNLLTMRPCDVAETAAAWRVGLLNRNGPTALALTRQAIPEMERDPGGMSVWEGVARGGYTLRDAEGTVKVVLIATGSEVHVAMQAADLLQAQGIGTRVVSMPCCELFDQQDRTYKRSVLPAGAAKLSIEAGISRGWERYTGADGASVGLDRFGYSAPANVLAEKLGFTADYVAHRAKGLIGLT